MDSGDETVEDSREVVAASLIDATTDSGGHRLPVVSVESGESQSTEQGERLGQLSLRVRPEAEADRSA